MSEIRMMGRDISKKFCRSLRRSMYFAAKDIVRNALGLTTRSEVLREGEFWAVDGVDFELEAGHSLGLIGPNGAGKSTLLKILNGIILPDRGEVTIRGRVGALIEVGAGFHPQLTGRENIYINGAILGMGRQEIRRKFDQIVEFSGLEEFLDTPVKFYSSGMYVRLGFSVAAHLDPDILLVDEILAVGDARFRRRCIERLQELQKQGVAFVIVSHNMQTIDATSTECLYLSQGRVEARGRPDQVVSQYLLKMGPEVREKETSVPDSPKPSDESLSLVHKWTEWEAGEMDFIRVWSENREGETTRRFEAEEDLLLCIRFRKVVPEKVREGFFWIAFINEWGVNSMGARIRFSEIPEEGILRVRFSPVQLATGQYKVSIHCQDKAFSVPYSTGHYGYIQVTNAVPGINPGHNTPCCFPPVRWEIEKG